ncbi:L-asparaginase isoform X1 [Spodoptera frugiperda]|uniref:L-asparaginase isoform X1 n=1 Tax=Spodoptera frugiperda TaxID=7108 RepID=A0A9R0D7U8_SPOFR|nr:L-asparaginase isoform X1 [Spodoptera frugiperda]
MNKKIHNRISITTSTPGGTYNDAVTSTESQRLQDGEPTREIAQPTYASRFWFFNYLKMCSFRLTNDLYISFMTYWYPDREILPAHIVNLMQVQSRLRAERESHAVTLSSSREQGEETSPVSLRNFFNALTYYVLSSEDEVGVHFTPRDLDFLGSDREPMFVLVDSSCISDPSSKELLIDNGFHARDTVLTKYLNNNGAPVDLPSTSTDLRNELVPPLLRGTDSSDEMQMIDINLQSDNELLIGDSDCDNDSIVISYLRNKDAFLDFEAYSDESLDAEIPSFPTSMRSLFDQEFVESHASLSVLSLFSNEDTNKYKKAIEFLHNDNDFLIAAEMGDEKMLQILLNRGANINDKDHLGRNALHLAVCSGNQDSVLLLLKAGVTVNIKDHLGMTPLSLCLMRRPSWRMASMLFDHGARLMPRLTPMDTGLFLQFVMMCIPTREEERILRLLVEKGAIVNDPDAPGGRQPLHFAAMSNNIRLINILVDLGADLYAVNHRNQTPKEVAATFNCREAFGLLEQFEELCSLIVDIDEEALVGSSSRSIIGDNVRFNN